MKRLVALGLAIAVMAGCTSGAGPASPPPTGANELTATAVGATASPGAGPPATATSVPVATATAGQVATATAASQATTLAATATATAAAAPQPPTPSATAATRPTNTPAPTATAVAPVATAQPPGQQSSEIPDIALEPAFPKLPPGAFGNRPLYFAEVPDGSGRAVVVEQSGKVFIVEMSPEASEARLFLDLSSKVSTAGNEEGLLGLAFDPDFAKNGQFFLYYSAANPRRSIVSRFQAKTGASSADPASERLVMEIPQPYANHNGGMLEFGPDGFLYVGLGDGGSGGDPHGNGQNLAELLGSILRIDVRNAPSGRTYAIPGDNPFVGRPETEARHEVWAYGLRNPWRFSFDRSTGDLWAGDVGQNSWEEVDLIVRGGNYGWSIMEGAQCFRSGTCNMSGLAQPLAEYRTGQFGCAVTGGYVYRGRKLPSLQGVYLYADYCSGLIWGLRYRDGKVVAGPRLVADTGRLVPSFGQDAEGELYVTSFGGSGHAPGVYRIVAR